MSSGFVNMCQIIFWEFSKCWLDTQAKSSNWLRRKAYRLHGLADPMNAVLKWYEYAEYYEART